MAKDPADSKEKKLLKILCLHGYRQNGTVFREKTGAFRKALKKHAVFDFVDAPHVPVVPAQSNGESSSGAKDDKYTPRAWWFSKAQKTFSSWDETEIAEGFEFSVRDVLQYIKENGPYDGIMGFSQGACMTHLLATMNKKSTAGAENTEKLFKFVIIVAGFKSLSLVHNDQNTVFISNLPSLHIYGTGDEIVPNWKSQKLSEMYTAPGAKIVVHEGGHCVPPISKIKSDVISFLESVAI